MKQLLSRLWFIVGVSIILTACDDEHNTYSYDSSMISMIVADNANLSLLSAANKRTGVYEMLLEEGAYTLLAPTNDAFALSGYSDNDINSIGLSKLTKITNYHILTGEYEFDKLPFIFNQEIASYGGGKLFVTRWTKQTDTIVTINGAVVNSFLKKANNGNLQVIDRVLEPYLFDYLSDALANEPELTLFSHAVQRSKELHQLLSNKGAFTVYAPNNSAMIAYGLSSLQVINETSEEELVALLKYHIVSDRRFVYDYFLTTEGDATSETMLNGDNLLIYFDYDYNTGKFSGITLEGIRNTTDTNLTRENILSGNGVLHIIDQVLLN